MFHLTKCNDKWLGAIPIASWLIKEKGGTYELASKNQNLCLLCNIWDPLKESLQESIDRRSTYLLALFPIFNFKWNELITGEGVLGTIIVV